KPLAQRFGQFAVAAGGIDDFNPHDAALLRLHEVLRDERTRNAQLAGDLLLRHIALVVQAGYLHHGAQLFVAYFGFRGDHSATSSLAMGSLQGTVSPGWARISVSVPV